MPGLSGWEVAEAIRATSPATAIVLITGMVSEEVIHRARVRALLLLPKPFGLAELEGIVTRALRAVGKDLPGSVVRAQRVPDKLIEEGAPGTVQESGRDRDSSRTLESNLP